MNILILSAGTRNKLVQYFKKELNKNGKVIATDCSELAPAVYEADKFYKVSRIDSSSYIAEVIGICKKENSSSQSGKKYGGGLYKRRSYLYIGTGHYELLSMAGNG